MTNPIYVYPKNLGEEHQKMILETNSKEAELRVIKVNERYPNIAKQYKALCKQYEYQQDGFIIRPAANAGEIVVEGQTLHHCVGGDHYLEAHNNGTSLILLLRPTAEKQIPFITVELYNNYKIRQWHGAYNKKILKKDIDAWLKAYTTKLEADTLNCEAWSGVA